MPHLGKTPWETPLGVVTQGMESVVDHFYQGYGDQQPFNKDGINQVTLQQLGNEYLRYSLCTRETLSIARVGACARSFGQMLPHVLELLG